MRLTSAHLQVFRELSHDRNPLHTDEDYARKTEFGRTVAYGVSGVLSVLGHWAKGRAFSLKSIEAQFKKPLFADTDYETTVAEAGSKVTARILQGKSVHCKITLEWEPAEKHSKPFSAPLIFRAEPVAKISPTLPAGNSLTYSLNEDLSEDLAKHFALHPSQLPMAQLNALLAASYLVGMWNPGKQALFSDLEFRFKPETHSAEAFRLEILEASFHEQFRLATLAGRGTGIESFVIHAFQRPEPIRYSLEEVRRAVGTSKSLAGKTVLISGAGRGFGSVLARAFALQGAHVVVNYFKSAEDALRLKRELSADSEMRLLQGDAGSAESCARMAAELKASGTELDFLVNNASPTIRSQPFQEQAPSEYLDFVYRSLSQFSVFTHAFLPCLKAGGTVLDVSSIYARSPVPGFSHYVAAKSATEGLTRALAAEDKRHRFVIARPPRMLTDQTNTVSVESAPPESAAEISARLMQRLSEIEGKDASANLFEFDLI